MKYVAVALISLLGVSADAADGTSWIHGGPLESQRKAEDLPRTEFAEVVASRVERAAEDLANRQFVLLSARDVASYVGESFRCADTAKPFLVRAVSGHAGTGAYRVQRLDSVIFVSHSSLGRSTPIPTKSALVVCAKEVLEVFTTFGVAE